MDSADSCRKSRTWPRPPLLIKSAETSSARPSWTRRRGERGATAVDGISSVSCIPQRRGANAARPAGVLGASRTIYPSSTWPPPPERAEPSDMWQLHRGRSTSSPSAFFLHTCLHPPFAPPAPWQEQTHAAVFTSGSSIKHHQDPLTSAAAGEASAGGV